MLTSDNKPNNIDKKENNTNVMEEELALSTIGSPPVFSWVRVAQFLVFCVVFYTLLFALFLLTIVLSVLRFTILITPLVSSIFLNKDAFQRD